MPLTKDQIQEIKSILKTTMLEFFNDKEFKTMISAQLRVIIDKKMEEQEIKYMEKIKILEEKIDAMEQYSRRNNIRIYGVAEDPTTPIDKQVQLIIRKMNIENKKIDECYRIGRAGDQSRKVRPIFVKFHNYEDKHEVISNRKKLKGTRINIREDLTRTRLEIITKAASIYGVKNVWSLEGKIFGSINGEKITFGRLEDITN